MLQSSWGTVRCGDVFTMKCSCPECDYACDVNYNLYRHLRIKHAYGVERIEEMKKKAMEEREEARKGRQTGHFTCQHCHDRFPSLKRKNHHIKRKHNKVAVVTPANDGCPFDGFDMGEGTAQMGEHSISKGDKSHREDIEDTDPASIGGEAREGGEDRKKEDKHSLKKDKTLLRDSIYKHLDECRIRLDRAVKADKDNERIRKLEENIRAALVQFKRKGEAKIGRPFYVKKERGIEPPSRIELHEYDEQSPRPTTKWPRKRKRREEDEEEEQPRCFVPDLTTCSTCKCPLPLGLPIHNEEDLSWVKCDECGQWSHEICGVVDMAQEKSTSKENASNLLPTDDLSSLREGDVYTDPNTGKQFRVRKTILPHYSSSGPYGLGDPEDRTLRRIEADVIIPNRMNTQIERVECNSQYLELIRCFREEGAVKGLSSCKPTLSLFNACKSEKFHDVDFRERLTEEYLRERSEARRTGLTTKQRKLEEFRQWKEKQDTPSSK